MARAGELLNDRGADEPCRASDEYTHVDAPGPQDAAVIDTYGGPNGPGYEYTVDISIFQIQSCELYRG